MGTLGVKGKLQAPSTFEAQKQPNVSPVKIDEVITVSKPTYHTVEVVEQVSKPVFKVVDKVESIHKPVYEIKEAIYVVEIPKPELKNVNQSIADIHLKLESLAAQVPMLPTVKTEVISVLPSGALLSIISLSVANIIALGVIAWLLS